MEASPQPRRSSRNRGIETIPSVRRKRRRAAMTSTSAHGSLDVDSGAGAATKTETETTSSRPRRSTRNRLQNTDSPPLKNIDSSQEGGRDGNRRNINSPTSTAKPSTETSPARKRSRRNSITHTNTEAEVGPENTLVPLQVHRLHLHIQNHQRDRKIQKLPVTLKESHLIEKAPGHPGRDLSTYRTTIHWLQPKALQTQTDKKIGITTNMPTQPIRTGNKPSS